MLSNVNDGIMDIDSIGIEGGIKKRGNAGSSCYKKDNAVVAKKACMG